MSVRFTHYRAEIFFICAIALLFTLGIRLLFPFISPYDYYAKLASAFLSGHVCLQENYPWLNELIPIPGAGYCVVYPITPALLLLPFIAVVPTFSQTAFSHLIFGVSSAVVYVFMRKEKRSRLWSLGLACTWGFATIFFSLSAVGSAWYIAQTIGAFFALCTLCTFSTDKKKNLFLSGFLLSLAATSRLPYHLFLLYFLWKIVRTHRAHLKKMLLYAAIFILGFLPIFTLQRLYNYVRYQTVADQGYYLIPGKFEEEDFKNGEFHITNIPKHLEVFLLKLPKKVDTFPYLVPSYYGLSILITSPFLVFAVYSLYKNRLYAESITILLILGVEMSHGTVGFTQFGYRFALDVYPLLFYALSKFHMKKMTTLLFIILVVFSVLVNLWGVFALRNEWFIW